MLTPLLSLFISLKNIKSSWAKNVIWAFTVFYGFTFTITEKNAKSDINRYIRWFYDMRNSNMEFDEFLGLLYVDKNYADLLQPLLTFTISKLTDNHAWLLAGFGFIFGYFYSRNLAFVVERLNGKYNGKIMFLLVILALVVPIWNINGFRFWTATHIFIFGLLRLIYDRKKIYIIPILLTVFVHYSFMLPVSLTLLYLIIGDRLKIYFYLFIISFFVTEINVGSAISNTTSSFLPEIFVERSAGYLSDDSENSTINQEVAKTEAQVNRSWYAIFYLKALNWAITAHLIFIFFYCKKTIEDNAQLRNLLSFLFYFFACSNVLSLVPSGVRYVVISMLISMFIIVLFIQELSNLEKYTLLFKCSLPLFLLYGAITLRGSLNSVSVKTVAGNPAIALFMEENVGIVNLR